MQNSELLDQMFNDDEESKPYLVEQYKLYVQTADNLTAARQQSNTFFLTINTALIGFVSASVEFSSIGMISQWIMFALCAGIILCVAWYFLLQSYRNLNSAKFAVIQALEEKLAAQIYKYEWQIALSRPGRRYIRLTRVEQLIPILFVLLYVAFITAILIVT